MHTWKRGSHSHGIKQRLPCPWFWKITYPVGSSKKDLYAIGCSIINRKRFAKTSRIFLLRSPSCLYLFFPLFLFLSLTLLLSYSLTYTHSFSLFSLLLPFSLTFSSFSFLLSLLLSLLWLFPSEKEEIQNKK